MNILWFIVKKKSYLLLRRNKRSGLNKWNIKSIG